jgi:hypothetical protein
MVLSILIRLLVLLPKNKYIFSLDHSGGFYNIFSIFFDMSATEFLSFLISSLVIDTTAIEIVEKEDELGTLLSLRVNPSDMGSLIGR